VYYAGNKNKPYVAIVDKGSRGFEKEKMINFREQIEQMPEKEKRQFNAWKNDYLGRELAKKRRRAVAEAQTKEELGVETETET